MQIIKSLLALGLVASVSSSPVAQLEAIVAPRSANPCDGGRDWCGWYDKKKNIEPQCKCPKGQDWDSSRHKCRAPPHPKPKVGSRQKAICARDKDNWCDYDANDDLCANDGKSVVIIVEVSISITVLKPIITEECEKPKCAKGQSWSSSERKCKYPSLPKEQASSCKRNGGRPICAKTPKSFCDFDEREPWCEDDGINCLQCIEPRAKPESILDKIFAGLDQAVEVMGYDCLNKGGSCSMTSGKYDKLCIGADCVADLLCSLLGIVGLC